MNPCRRKPDPKAEAAMDAMLARGVESSDPLIAEWASVLSRDRKGKKGRTRRMKLKPKGKLRPYAE